MGSENCLAGEGTPLVGVAAACCCAMVVTVVDAGAKAGFKCALESL